MSRKGTSPEEDKDSDMKNPDTRLEFEFEFEFQKINKKKNYRFEMQKKSKKKKKPETSSDGYWRVSENERMEEVNCFEKSNKYINKKRKKKWEQL